MDRKIPFRLTSNNIGKAANQCAYLIKEHSKENPITTDSLMESTGFTKGQISTIIKYMRRSSEQDISRYIRWYPVSSKRGYFFAKNFEEFGPCYATLEKWAASLHRTIQPMREQMQREGIDWRQYLPKAEDNEIVSNYLEDVEETNKDTAWFLED